MRLRWLPPFGPFFAKGRIWWPLDGEHGWYFQIPIPRIRFDMTAIRFAITHRDSIHFRSDKGN